MCESKVGMRLSGGQVGGRGSDSEQNCLCRKAQLVLTIFNLPQRLRSDCLLLPHVLHQEGKRLKGFPDLSEQAQDAPDYAGRVTCALSTTSTERVGSEPHQLSRKVGYAEEIAMRRDRKEESRWDRKGLAV